MQNYYVYILTDDRNKIFYTGLSDDVLRRNYEHKMGIYDGFTKRYSVHKLVYYEVHCFYDQAMHREKLIKRWKRNYKINVIEKMNPHWDDLYYQLLEADYAAHRTPPCGGV
jgi:putative endonuclease